MNKRSYDTKRMKLIWTKGPIFYLEYQIRLFLFLLFHKAELFYANDLDTLLPNYLRSRLTSAKLIYDSHELFTEVPELINNPKKRKIWKRLERWLFPKVNSIITVNDSIAKLYEEEYHKKLTVVRNIPIPRSLDNMLSREELSLPKDKKILILQGAGINVHRGSEEAVEAMQYLEGMLLLIVGSGDVIEKLKAMRKDLHLEDKIIITGKVAYEQLAQYTRQADLGLSLDKDTNLNYRYSLPNKLFDYIFAGVPVLVSPLVEISRIVNEYQIGGIINNHQPKEIAKTISQAFDNKEQYKEWKYNLIRAQKELKWENEEKNLLKCIAEA